MTNSEAIAQVCSPSFDPNSFNYQCNGGEIKDLFSDEDKKRINEPGRDWAQKQIDKALKDQLEEEEVKKVLLEAI